MDEQLDPGPLTPNESESLKHSRKVKLSVVALALVFLLLGVWFIWKAKDKEEPVQQNENTVQESNEPSTPKVEPTLETKTMVTGHSNIWDTAFPDEDTLLYTLRDGEIWGYSLASSEKWQIAALNQVRAEGEGGLLGMTLDIQFKENRLGYICYNSTGSPRTVRVARFHLSEDKKSIDSISEIIPDIESQGGRHSGCRLAMDKDNVLWVTTGDSALRTAPQNPKSLAGKVLRVDRNGKAAGGNLPAPFDSRIYSYGHRNLQGIVLFDKALANGALGYSSEHGPGKEDEINWLLPGNFGWDPAGSRAGYDESVPMTDKQKYPDAIEAIWNSGSSTIAVSGMTILDSEGWSAWQGRVVTAVLKNKHVRMIEFDNTGKVLSEKELFRNEFGRIRSVREGPQGSLYLTTDNGSDDKIIKISPTTTF